RPRALGGVRARSATAAVLVVALALAAGAAAFVLLLQRALITTVEQGASTRAAEVAAQVRRDGVGDLATGLGSVPEGEAVQVADPAGRVVSTSSQRARQRPLTDVRAPDNVVRALRASSLPLLDNDDPYLLAVAGS